MIAITVDESKPLGQFIIFTAQQLGKSPTEVGTQMMQDRFEETIHNLHMRFLNGEFTQGEFAHLLGVERIDLIHLLDDMGLTATNV